jgi:BolA protein
MSGPVQARIQEKLLRDLEPQHLEITNESYKHSVPKGSESHFKVAELVPFLNIRSLLYRISSLAFLLSSSINW